MHMSSILGQGSKLQGFLVRFKESFLGQNAIYVIQELYGKTEMFRLLS